MNTNHEAPGASAGASTAMTVSSQPIAYCAVCGKGLNAGDLMCNHTELEVARYKRDGCACGGDHVGEVTITTPDAPTCSGDNERTEA